MRIINPAGAGIVFLILFLCVVSGNTADMPAHLQTGATTTYYPVTVHHGTSGGNFAEGETVTLNADAAPYGQRFKQWTFEPSVTFVEATGVATATVKFTMPAHEVTATATYEAIPETTYAVTVTGGSGSGSFAANATITLTANAPQQGELFKQWIFVPSVTFVEGTRPTTATVKFTMPARAVTATATYEVIPVSANVVTVINGTGGGNFASGATVTLTANAAPQGQLFRQWTFTPSVTFVEGTGATTATVKFTMPAQTVTATATYEDIPEPPVTVASVIVSPDVVSVGKGDTQSFSATVAGTGNPAQTVTWEVAGVEGTTITAAGVLTIAAGETATTLAVTATSTVDGARSGTATVTVTSPAVVPDGITGGYETDFASERNVYPNPFTGEVHITGFAESNSPLWLRIFNASGVAVHAQKLANPGETLHLEHLPAGVYFFRFEKEGKMNMVKVVRN